MGAKPDGYALAVGNGRGALQRIVGNIKGENIGFGLTGYTARHDVHPHKSFDRRANPYRAIVRAAVPCVTLRVWIKLFAAAGHRESRLI